ncbi:MAG: hypothetical protein MJZ76_04375 [Bacteroidales bacterium]|nr:hypothetical protein [Bacteroidales bacterium]
MKKIIALICIIASLVICTTSCHKDEQDCSIRWTVKTIHSEASEGDIQLDKNSIYKAFDAHFSKASFGSFDKSNHKINIEGATPNKVKKYKEDAKKFALKANDELANFHPTSGEFEITVTFSGKDGDETLVTYKY